MISSSRRFLIRSRIARNSRPHHSFSSYSWQHNRPVRFVVVNLLQIRVQVRARKLRFVIAVVKHTRLCQRSDERVGNLLNVITMLAGKRQRDGKSLGLGWRVMRLCVGCCWRFGERIVRQHAAREFRQDAVRFGGAVVVLLAVELEILVGAFRFGIVQRLPAGEGFGQTQASAWAIRSRMAAGSVARARGRGGLAVRLRLAGARLRRAVGVPRRCPRRSRIRRAWRRAVPVGRSAGCRECRHRAPCAGRRARLAAPSRCHRARSSSRSMWKMPKPQSRAIARPSARAAGGLGIAEGGRRRWLTIPHCARRNPHFNQRGPAEDFFGIARHGPVVRRGVQRFGLCEIARFAVQVGEDEVALSVMSIRITCKNSVSQTWMFASVNRVASSRRPRRAGGCAGCRAGPREVSVVAIPPCAASRARRGSRPGRTELRPAARGRGRDTRGTCIAPPRRRRVRPVAGPRRRSPGPPSGDRRAATLRTGSGCRWAFFNSSAASAFRC